MSQEGGAEGEAGGERTNENGGPAIAGTAIPKTC